MTFKPRPAQAKVLAYESGTLGVSAVPGSGKTHTLAMLAAKLAERLVRSADPAVPPGMEPIVLIVTFSNAAVNNFKDRIGRMMADRGLIPGIGYSVKTLHAMAAEIIREGGANYGLDPEAAIVDQTMSEYILQKIIRRTPREHLRGLFDLVANENLEISKRDKAFSEKWCDYLMKVTQAVIKRAKDLEISAQRLNELLELVPSPDRSSYLLLQGIAEFYEQYQSQLAAYPGYDFEDLMTNAYRILDSDERLLAFYQKRWPFILEDEAQDSSAIQERVLRLLSGETGNWVRVGDPNQAINVTFTTSNPHYLLDFLMEADMKVELDCSGRSTKSILAAANHLIRWTMRDHPLESMRSALTEPYIYLTPRDDASPNPKDEPLRVVFDPKRYTSDEEKVIIAKLALEHSKTHPNETIAILVTSNDRGFKFSEYLRAAGSDPVEFLQSSSKDRDTGAILDAIFKWLATPRGRANPFKGVVEALTKRPRELDFFLSDDDRTRLFNVIELYKGERIVDLLYPENEAELERDLRETGGSEFMFQTLIRICELARKWIESRSLRIDQLILLIAQDIFIDPVDLSIANRLGRAMLRLLETEPTMNFEEIAKQIVDVANRPEISAQSEEQSEFDPKLYRGKIVVTTYHKAKGLEWDQVYLTSLNQYDFPIGQRYREDGYIESYRSQVGYVRDRLDLQSELMEQLDCLNAEPRRTYYEGIATKRSADEFAAERLRLLFVGITRAKKGLYCSHNTGKFRNMRESIVVRSLRESLERGKEAA